MSVVDGAWEADDGRRDGRTQAVGRSVGRGQRRVGGRGGRGRRRI